MGEKLKKINLFLCIIVTMTLFLIGCNKIDNNETNITEFNALNSTITYCLETEMVSLNIGFYYVPIITNMDITKLEIMGYACSITPNAEYDANKDLNIKIKLSESQDKLNMILNDEKKISFYKFNYEIINVKNIEYNKKIEFKNLDLRVFANEETEEIHYDDTYYILDIVTELNLDKIINWNCVIDDYILQNSNLLLT